MGLTAYAVMKLTLKFVSDVNEAWEENEKDGEYGYQVSSYLSLNVLKCANAETTSM